MQLTRPGALAASLFLALASHAALAADTTPVARPPDASPSASPSAGRLANARKAIAARNWSAALTELQAAERDEPRNADVHNLMAYSYRKSATPDLPKAFAHYKTALEIDPRHKGAHEYIGEAYLMDKRPAEAEKHLAELERICGNRNCEEYRDLAKSIAEYKARN